MSISFVRIDDRIIHGQVITRWSKEFPCDGIIAVNNKVAATPVLKQSFVASSSTKVFVWTIDEFLAKKDKVLSSDKNYFLITKNPIDMATLLVDEKVVPSNVKRVVVGPCNDRPGAIKLGNNQSVIPDEAAAFEKIVGAGYEVLFSLIPDTPIGTWDKFRSKFGY